MIPKSSSEWLLSIVYPLILDVPLEKGLTKKWKLSALALKTFLHKSLKTLNSFLHFFHYFNIIHAKAVQTSITHITRKFCVILNYK